jgi:cyanophycinase
MRGWIIPIGGKLMTPTIIERFVALAGGKDARIAVIPTASNEPDMGTYYERLFVRHGVGAAKSLNFERRTDCDDADWLAWLDSATGVFLTGGNQLKLSSILGGTPVAARLRALNAAGVPIAGTSAGAAYLSEHMIAWGDEGSTPRVGMVHVTAGLGLSNRVIVDQHFRQRDRLGRLLTALAYNPFCLGIGVDEDTAAFISSDDTVDIVGTGAVTIVDPSQLEYCSVASAAVGEPIDMVGMRVHVLGAGSTFNLQTRVMVPAAHTSPLSYR